MGKDLKGKELGTGISQRSDGRYMARYKRKSKYADTEKEIRRVYRQLVMDIENNTYIDTNNITLNDYFEQWLDSRFDIKGSTKSSYKRWYAWIKQLLGNKKVQKITKTDVKKLQSSLFMSGKSPATVNSTINLLKNIMNTARDEEIIIINPCDTIKEIKKNKSNAAVNNIHRALSKEEQALFMQEAKVSWFYNMIDFMIRTGIRTGEARGLRWVDIDYKNNVIHIRNNITVDENEKEINSTPKTETSIRDIPLTKELKVILDRQKKQYREYIGNIQKIDGTVFVNHNGKTLGKNSLYHEIKRIFRHLDDKGIHIESITPHGLRDTFATRAIENGMNPQTLKKILGHTNLSMTMDLYAHVLPNTMQEEMEKIAKAF